MRDFLNRHKITAIHSWLLHFGIKKSVCRVCYFCLANEILCGVNIPSYPSPLQEIVIVTFLSPVTLISTIESFKWFAFLLY